MSTSILPAIVVLAYKRPRSLQRLLSSLNAANYPKGVLVPLVLSIDKGSEEVLRFCELFDWKHGEKKLRRVSERMGIREHVMLCGDLSEEYGAIIMLEDDLMVSRHFYNYATEAMASYRDCDQVGGFALFHHQLNETAKRAFSPIHDGNDVYFLQLAASWGQFWTDRQWKRFRKWCVPLTYEEINMQPIPWDVKKWPRSSWKKWFTAYLVEQDLYLVYPRFSQSTNFMEPGEHNPVKDANLQTELDHSKRHWRFQDFNQSLARYDSYCEINPDILKKLNPKLEPFDFEVDLLGTKSLGDLTKPYLLTIRDCSDSIYGFERSLRPEASNIIFDLQGDDLHLACVSKVIPRYEPWLKDEINYSYSVPQKILSRLIIQHIEEKTLYIGVVIFLRIFLGKFSRLFQKKHKNSKEMAIKKLCSEEKTDDHMIHSTET